MAVAAGIAGIIVHAAGIEVDDGTLWLTATGVIVALVALGAAAAAAVFAYPAYRDWRSGQPDDEDIWVSIWATANTDRDDLRLVEDKSRHEVPGGTRGMFVRVAVHNDGGGVVRSGILNVMVPARFAIRPEDDPRVVHRLVPGTAGNGAILPGKTTTVRLTAASDDFPPGVRMFHVTIAEFVPRGWTGDLPDGTAVPLFVEMEGSGLHAPKTRRVTLVAR